MKHTDNGWFCEGRKAHILSFSTAFSYSKNEGNFISFYFGCSSDIALSKQTVPLLQNS